MPFPYKTVLITGATSGIGLALAERMIANGIFVIAVGRRVERLEALAAKHGRDKVAVEARDVADLDGLPAWIKHITTTYPSLDCVVLNAGFQNTTDFVGPDADPARLSATFAAETALNYLSPVQSVAHFLPHLTSLAASQHKPTAVVLVSSCLALVPMSRCASYCATKAALHSFAWALRSQLQYRQQQQQQDASAAGGAANVRVIEILPPAVRTELHSRQPDLVAAGVGDFGMELDDFTDETWAALTAPEGRDEIIVGPNRDGLAPLEDGKRGVFVRLEKTIREVGKA